MPRKQKPKQLPLIVSSLIAHREVAGLSRGELAKKLGYSRDAIYGWETGTITPNFQSLVDWCGFFGFVLDLRDARE